MDCQNYQLCQNKIHLFLSAYKRCSECDYLFHKKLNFIDLAECPICYEFKPSIQLLNCNHSICIDCFKRAWYGEALPIPNFPFPEYENAYFDNPLDEVWLEYPEITRWEMRCDEIQNEMCIRYENEEYLRKCPFCRK